MEAIIELNLFSLETVFNILFKTYLTNNKNMYNCLTDPVDETWTLFASTVGP